MTLVAPFRLQGDIHQNVKELRRALGSATKSLSPADLAKLLNARDPKRKRALSTVQRWEAHVEPDIRSIELMAKMAGVTFEEFALGNGEPVLSGKDALQQAVAATAGKAAVEPKDVPAPRGSGLAKKPPEKGRESA